jgi:hypothetical protein
METIMNSVWARAFQYLVFAAAAFYLADWAILAVRVKAGSGMGTVTVSQYLSTPLKGQKVEYDYLGKADQSCVHSVFSHRGNLPCWWLERHKNQWQ